MKTQETTHKIKQNSMWLSTGLVFSGLMAISSVSLAQEGVWTQKADMSTTRLALSLVSENALLFIQPKQSCDLFNHVGPHCRQ